MTVPKQSVSLAFGPGHWTTPETSQVLQRQLTQVLRDHKITTLDTARHYAHGESETALGDDGLASEFRIITKPTMALKPGGATKAGILEDWEASSKALRTEHVEYYVLHNPVPDTPISETMEGIQELYLAGHFTHFGLSNFSAAEVDEYHTYAKEKCYVLPTVYQGLYSLVHRKTETDLFPTLRRLGIAFQAYSSLATGFLARNPASIKAGEGNFSYDTVLGKILHEMYGKSSYLKYLEDFIVLAKESENSQAGLAYRWVVHNSVLGEDGDCVVIGATKVAQLEETIKEIERGPLEEWVLEKLETMWKTIEADAPGDNFVTFKKLKAAGVL